MVPRTTSPFWRFLFQSEQGIIAPFGSDEDLDSSNSWTILRLAATSSWPTFTHFSFICYFWSRQTVPAIVLQDRRNYQQNIFHVIKWQQVTKTAVSFERFRRVPDSPSSFTCSALPLLVSAKRTLSRFLGYQSINSESENHVGTTHHDAVVRGFHGSIYEWNLMCGFLTRTVLWNAFNGNDVVRFHCCCTLVQLWWMWYLCSTCQVP